MDKISVIIILGLIYLYLVNSVEYFEEVSVNNSKLPDLKCCLIKKKYVPDETNSLGGKFIYDYSKLENENCDLSLFRLDDKQQLYLEGENNWTNDKCRPDYLVGSCRRSNKECIDFVDKDFCDKYEMEWSNKTCHDNLEYKWEDKVKVEMPENKPNEFRMF